jgi:arginine utilization regulatory protein
VLIYGETGTGKEIIAQGIHNASPRKQEPFLALNCAAIPETLLESTLFGTCRGAFTGATDSPGLFEQAGGGTLYLDEINSMNPSLQAKLLRVLEEKTVRRVGGKQSIPVKCSIISSTNVDPWKCVVEGSLRQDLYFRLAGVTLSIPPLRSRREDITDLVSHFLKKFNAIYGRRIKGLSPHVKVLFDSYAWPGNVRELQHVLEAAVLAAEDATTIDFQHLPLHFRQRLCDAHTGPPRSRTPATSLGQTLQETERQIICEALAKTGNNVSRAAALLGLSRQNLQYRMRRLGIPTKDPTSRRTASTAEAGVT